jgi:acyl-CoA thioesterase FadM
MIYGIFVHGTDQLVASGRSVNAWANYAAEQAVELPDWFRAALAEYQKSE